MTLLDASALVAFFQDEPAAEEVEQLLRSEQGAAVSSVNLAETIDILVRVFRHEMETLEGRLVPLLVHSLQVITVDETAARRGAQIRIDHYRSREADLSLADCILLGTALSRGMPVATSDRLMAEVARTEAIDLIALPDSSGSRP